MKRFIVLVVLLLIAVIAVSAEPKFKIGLVFDLAGRGDNSFNDSAYNGLVALAKATRAGSRTIPTKSISVTRSRSSTSSPRRADRTARSSCGPSPRTATSTSIGVGFLFSDALAKVAKDFPDIHFGLIDGYIPDLTDSSNITCLGFKENEGSFLVGAIAAS